MVDCNKNLSHDMRWTLRSPVEAQGRLVLVCKVGLFLASRGITGHTGYRYENSV